LLEIKAPDSQFANMTNLSTCCLVNNTLQVGTVTDGSTSGDDGMYDIASTLSNVNESNEWMVESAEYEGECKFLCIQLRTREMLQT
jgi:hypothetical protein